MPQIFVSEIYSQKKEMKDANKRKEGMLMFKILETKQ